MYATLGLLAGLTLAATPKPVDHARLARLLAQQTRARVSVWMDQTDPYQRGERAHVYVSATDDAYLTILRIDTDGRVRILFPVEPYDDNYIRGGRTFEVEGRDAREAFRVDDAPGAGYVFAIASDDRFDYTPITTTRDHWDYRAISDGQVRGDPYVAVTDLAERIAGQEGYDYDLAQYDVERHYDYPRFVCYDCHAYAPFYAWNPYAHSCIRFRVVIYDDPYYYPYRYYRGRRVVVVRPRRPEPRYVFVDNRGGDSYVTRLPTRPRREAGTTPTPGELRPRRADDVGGRGAIPTPYDRRRPTREAQPRPEARPEQRPGDTGQRPDSRRPERRPAGDQRRDTPVIRPQPPAPEAERPRQEEPKPKPPAREERRRDEPRAEPHPRPRPQPRAEPRRDPPRAEPRRDQPRPQPQPRAEPRREGGSSRPTPSPQLRRRKP